MPSKLIKGLHIVKARRADGGAAKEYIYAWKGGDRMLSDPNDPVAFEAEYAKLVRERVQSFETLAALVKAYRASPEWADLADMSNGVQSGPRIGA